MIIIIKNRDRSLKLEGVVFAQKRLRPGHSLLPVLEEKQRTLEAGIRGEERVAEIFRKHSFSFDNHVFHDLSPTGDEKFQMDSVVLTPWYGVVFDAKNIAGTLEFKENPPQLIRTLDDGHKDAFESPVIKLRRNYECLNEWLISRNIYIPIYRAVVLAYPKQRVTCPPANTTLLFPYAIPTFLKDIPRQKQVIDYETFNWISAELLNSHQPFIPDPICQTYRIPFGDFQPGVQCVVGCGRFGMVKLPRTWQCPFCETTDHLAHQRALLEWFLIFKKEITNRECRWFLQVDDIYTANRILQSMDLVKEGSFKDRKYIMDFKNINFEVTPPNLHGSYTKNNIVRK